MKKLCLLPTFCRNGRLFAVAIHNPITGATVTLDLYAPGTGLTLMQIEANETKLTKLLRSADESGVPVVTSHFKQLLQALRLPLRLEKYNVYDLQLKLPDHQNGERCRTAIAKMVVRMADVPLLNVHKAAANAAVVYQSWEERGLLWGGVPQRTTWTQDTATGRSAAHGFNIQGLKKDTPVSISNPMGTERDVLLQFDWVAADVRVAATLSGDERLEESFSLSDPYTHMIDIMGGARSNVQLRSECKVALLRAINSMDVASPVFQVYEGLGDWIRRCSSRLDNPTGYLQTLLGRKFKMKDKETKLQVLNGCMQGSVAEAMKLAMREIWELVGHRLLAEIHDSLVISCDPRPSAIRSTIDEVSKILLKPFSSIDCECADLDFPFRVSVGRLWNGWSALETHRLSGVEKYRKANINVQASTDQVETQRDRKSEVSEWFTPSA